MNKEEKVFKFKKNINYLAQSCKYVLLATFLNLPYVMLGFKSSTSFQRNLAYSVFMGLVVVTVTFIAIFILDKFINKKGFRWNE